MKKLIIINGTMGVGKTATSKALYKKLENSVWLDGDWCWMMNPFIVNDENKEMVLDNITHLLRNFLMNSSLEYVIFNWVIHWEEIFDMVLSRLDGLEFEVIKITLICNEDSFRKRVSADIANNLREKEALDMGLERIPLYKNMNTIKIDTSDISVLETANKIIEIIKK
ncbi:AAA family ATPase [Clostridium aciditolerans]|uniref:AAA family ATPase n=1 Tax=Clostridium aciditolerans TaxID=339861 RepID=A0A934HRB6_9CLOT|nr:AAA family ATPase [Clostridium aciditolerans]MBI6871863.1 AAA family ATPase [Clostridium aciditolerans]